MKKKDLRVAIKEFRHLIKRHPLIAVTLLIGLIDWLILTPLIYFSGYFGGMGQEWLGGLLFLIYLVFGMILGLIDAVVYWILIFRR